MREALSDFRASLVPVVSPLSPDKAEDLLDRIELPIRELPVEPALLPELATGSLASVEARMFCVLMELPIRPPTAFSEPALRCVRVADIDRPCVPMEAPIRDVVPELWRLPELAGGSLVPAEAAVWFVLTELPMRKPNELPKPPADLLVVADTDCVCVPIERPIRAVLLELIRPPELADGSLAPVEPGVLFVLIELPIRQPTPLLELEVD